MYNSFPKENVELLALTLEVAEHGMIAKARDEDRDYSTRRISYYITKDIVDLNDPDRIKFEDVQRHFKGIIRLGIEELGEDPNKLYVADWNKDGYRTNAVCKPITDVDVVKDGEEIKHFEVFYANEDETEESIFVNIVQIFKKVEFEDEDDTMLQLGFLPLTEEFFRGYYDCLQYRGYREAVDLIRKICFNEQRESIGSFNVNGVRGFPIYILRSSYIKDRFNLILNSDSQDGMEDNFEHFHHVLNFTEVKTIDDNIIKVKFLLGGAQKEVAKEVKRLTYFTKGE